MRPRFAGVPFKRDQVKGHLTLTREPTVVAKGIITTGEIERTTDFESVGREYYVVDGRGRYQDSMIDEQALIINVHGRGLLIVTGCSHVGIINIARHAQRIAGVKRVYGIVGGSSPPEG